MADFRILTVCTGNVHRSAFAAVMLRTWCGWYLTSEVAARVTVDSAGTRAASGAPMDANVRAIVTALGGDGHEHRAVQLSDAALESADLVLVATRRHRDAVLSRVPSALRRTFTFREAGRIAELLKPARLPSVDELRSCVAVLADRRADVGAASPDDDIADPEGHGEEAFHRMVLEELPPLVSIARALIGMPEGDARAYREAAAAPLAYGVSAR